MTANGNEAVTLSQLKMFTESSNLGGGIGYAVPEPPPTDDHVGLATGDEAVTLSQFKMFVDSLVGSGGGGGNTGGFSNFIPVDVIGIEKIAERFVGQENPAILCIRNNDTGDLLVVHIPGVNNGEIYIDNYETSVFSDMDCSAVDIYSSHYAGSTVNVDIMDRTYGNLIYQLVLDHYPEGTSEHKYDSFDAYCTVFIMFLDGYYS